MPADITAAFFSYSREDKAFAQQLAAELKAAGANVWMDELDIQPGQRWDRSVRDALARCPLMLVILSPASVDSENVLDEIDFALEKSKTIIPVLHRDCETPLRLRRVQYIDFRADYERGLKALLKALGAKQQIAATVGSVNSTDAAQVPVPEVSKEKAPRKPEREQGERDRVVAAKAAPARVQDERPTAEPAPLGPQQKKPAPPERLVREEQSLFAQIASRVRWLKKNWKWALPVWVVGLGLIMGLVFYLIGDSEVAKIALARSQSNPAVVGRLGEPIKRGWFTEGNIDSSGSSGHADLSIPLSGPKGKGKLYVLASKSGGEWKFEALQFKPDDSSERLDLLQSMAPPSVPGSKPMAAADLPSDKGGCPAGERLCFSACVNLQTNRANCGACGAACPAGQACSNGRCAF